MPLLFPRRVLLSACALAAALAAAPALGGGLSDDPAEREARWQDIARAVFGDRKLENGDGVIGLDAPVRAEDASLVPIKVTLPDPASGKSPVAGMYLIIDDNPSPVAAHFTFGPAIDPHEIKLRVRVNTYTNVHAVAETADGSLYAIEKFVKASGGCSAPMGMSDEEALKNIGETRLRFAANAVANAPTVATLMVRHPNFNGMQMNQVTRDYTPARYIQSISVTTGDRKVFDLATDISLASNPVINFTFLPQGEARVVVADSAKDRWETSFPAPQLSN